MTAEFATVVPALLLVLGVGLAAIGAVVQQARLTDAAADAARSLARGDASEAARARVSVDVGAVAMTVSRDVGQVCVTVGQPVAGPASIIGLHVTGRGCALTDPETASAADAGGELP